MVKPDITAPYTGQVLMQQEYPTFGELTQDRRSPNAFGLDIEIDGDVTRLSSGRRKVGFVAYPSEQLGLFAAYVHEFDRRSGNTLPRYIGSSANLQTAIEAVARAYRAQIPSWLGYTR